MTNGFNNGFASIAANGFNVPNDGFAATMQGSTNTTPGTRSKSSAKARSKPKARLRAKRAGAAAR
jgi:hypothetical protein